jgi:Fe-S-cluster containining protein
MRQSVDNDSDCTDVIVEACTHCKHKDCCKDFLVYLSPSERLRLKNHVDYLPSIDPDALAFLAKRENGECYYLTPTGCSIWSSRPGACREYSCQEQDFLQVSIKL